tara:strand:- start:60 stop:296 length:237 start_codon:yes stop_codon:yes gene_type:complete
MIKIWFMLVLISMPNAPSVKYNGFLYTNEAECQVARYELLDMYDARPEDYKAGLAMDAYCIGFESFPIRGLNKTGTGI